MKKTPIWFWPIFAGFLFLSKICFLVFVLYVAETRPHPVEGPAHLMESQQAEDAEQTGGEG